MKNKLLIGSVVAVVAIIALALIWRFSSGAWVCHSQWKDSGMEYRYRLSSGCMVNPDKYWVPAANFRH